MSETTDTTEDTTEEVVEATDVEQAPQGAEALGDPGKKALDAMKAERNAERTTARELKAQLAALQAQVEGREAEHAAEQERQRAKDEALSAANKRILSAELRVAAKGKLADPTDAGLFINLDSFEVGDDGDVDTDAIANAIDELIARKPHLAAGGQRRFDGDADQGAGGPAQKVRQLTDADIESMSPAEINKARREGRLNTVLGIS